MGNVGGGEGPGSGEPPGLALGLAVHWLLSCGCPKNCRAGVLQLRRERKGGMPPGCALGGEQASLTLEASSESL